MALKNRTESFLSVCASQCPRLGGHQVRFVKGNKYTKILGTCIHFLLRFDYTRLKNMLSQSSIVMMIHDKLTLY